MADKPEVFAVVWQDFIPLSLHRPDAESACNEAARLVARMLETGHDDMAATVRACHIPAGSDALEFLPFAGMIDRASA